MFLLKFFLLFQYCGDFSIRFDRAESQTIRNYLYLQEFSVFVTCLFDEISKFMQRFNIAGKSRFSSNFSNPQKRFDEMKLAVLAPIKGNRITVAAIENASVCRKMSAFCSKNTTRNCEWLSAHRTQTRLRH